MTKIKHFLKKHFNIRREQNRYSYTTDFYIFGKKLFTRNKIYGENLYMALKNDIINQTMSSIYSLQNNDINHHFENYRGIHQGKKIVLLAAGPSLNNYVPIKNAFHIGVNKLATYNKVQLDYYFSGDYLAIKRYDIVDAIKQLQCNKFIGFTPLHDTNDTVLLQETLDWNAKRFLYLNYLDPNFIPMDISKHPLCGYSSIIFPALHFALFTEPDEIYLVGCDCSKDGHFDKKNTQDQANGLNPHEIIAEWELMKSFIQLRYPHIKIYSINPVGLRGMFEDIDQHKGNQ